MGRKARNEVTTGALQVASYCKELQRSSGQSVDDFAAECGLTHTYWHDRISGRAPLTISDCERIAHANRMTLRTFFINALNDGIDPDTGERVYDLTRDANEILDDTDNGIDLDSWANRIKAEEAVKTQE